MEDSKRILKYQIGEGRKSLVRFWITIIAVIILISLANRLGGENINIGIMMDDFEVNIIQSSIAGIGLIASFIYLIVYNYENYYKGFPLALSFSITRRDYGLGLMVKSLLIIFISSLIQAILFKVDPTIIKLAGGKVLHDFKIFDTKTDSIFYIIFALFIMFLSFASICNLIASLNYRFGYIFWIVMFGIYFITISISPLDTLVIEMWAIVGRIFVTRIGPSRFLKLAGMVIVTQGLAYFNTINTDIRYKSL